MARKSKHFETRKQWHNAVMMGWVAPLLLLIGVLVFAATGSLVVLIVMASLVLLGTLVALVRDIGQRSSYILGVGVLSVESGDHREDLPLTDIMDVSLIDRAGARSYIHGRLVDEGVRGRAAIRERLRSFVRYCSVDIGLTSYTFGIGRYFIDRLPNARHDVVLLRMRDGRAFLLSPAYNQELISSITRSVHAGQR